MSDKCRMSGEEHSTMFGTLGSKATNNTKNSVVHQAALSQQNYILIMGNQLKPGRSLLG